MYSLIAMILSLLLLVLLLHLKIKIGRSMLLSAFGLAILLGVTPSEFFHTFFQEWSEKPLSQTTGYLFISLSALVIFVNVLGTAMTETGVSSRLIPALQGLFKSRRAALAVIPLLMGMLPTPGGIMLSAPMVRELGDNIGMDRSRQAAINFFFRHQWESLWPLFPAVLLIRGMLGISAFALVSHNIVIVLSGILGGVCFLLIPAIPPKRDSSQHGKGFIDNFKNFLHAFWPIVMVGLLFTCFNITPAIGILLAILIFLIFHKVSLNRWKGIFKSGIEFDFILLILGALLFKLNLEAGQAINSVVQFLQDIKIPIHLLIFILPFLVAFLTGVTMPTVAITFPFLIPFIGLGENAKVELMTLAFSGLLCGLYITPVHLCLALSSSYFKAPLTKIVPMLIGPVFFIAAAGITMALVIR